MSDKLAPSRGCLNGLSWMAGFWLIVLLIFLLAGCKQDGYVEVGRVTEDKPRVFVGDADLPVVSDPETGCQYLGRSYYGLTPRLVWDHKRQQMMPMGCRIVEQR